MLTAERLKELLVYSEETGSFLWRGAHSRRVKAGDIAGSVSPKGYIVIGVDKKTYRAHRLAWLYVHGRWPLNDIDHINCIKADNRIVNLREITNAENQQNIKSAISSNKTSGFLGVSRSANRKKWRATIAINGQDIHLGYFDTPEKASDAYVSAKRKLHPASTL